MIATLPQLKSLRPAPVEPKPIFRFTKDQFYRMDDDGFFEDTRVELINGELIPMPGVMSYKHGWGVNKVRSLLEAALGSNYWPRMQLPLDLSPHSVPLPDVSVVLGNPDLISEEDVNPTTALLVVEVSISTLGNDRVRKASLYAASSIQDYWIVNYVHRCIEVYRNPVEDTNEEFGWRYSSTTVHETGEIAMLAVPTAKIEVAKLFP